MTKVAKITGFAVLLPDTLRPPGTPIDIVFEIIANNVDLLQKESHLITEVQVTDKALLFQTRCRKQATQTFTDESSNKVTIPIVFFHVFCSLTHVLVNKFCHARSHTFRNIRNDGTRVCAEFAENHLTLWKLLQETLFVTFTDTIQSPGGVVESVLVEIHQVFDLDGMRGKGSHFIFNRIQGSENEIKDENVHKELTW